MNDNEQFRKTNIIPYNSNWPLFYAEEARKIHNLIKEDLIAIHHIGSTAVPGMAAKPVIDILVVVKDITQLETHRVELESLGYHWKGEYGIPGRRYLWKVENDEIDFHLQCFSYDHIGAKNNLIFRDFLRSHPERALQYSAIKKQASEKYPSDTHAYWYEKKSFVDMLMKEALTWHRFSKNLSTASVLTPYPNINEVLFNVSNGIKDILDKDLIGLYLFGSLTYGDFNSDSSDIDLVSIINKPLNHHQLELIKQLHKKLEEHYPRWGKRLECSYTPVDMLNSILSPKESRPYYGDGIFYNEAPYGNEWIINNYLLYAYGIPIMGPDFKELTKPIDIIEVQKACIQDLFQEWQPKITDFEWLDNSHYQSYLVMTLCRILYTVMCGATGTKKMCAEWAKGEFGAPWKNLIETAESWKYGKVMSSRNETINFIKFTVNKIKQTTIYRQLYSNNN